MKRLLAIFAVSFVLNFLWEHAHAPLYASYQGGALTDFILLHAALGDAVIITLLGAAFLYVPFLRGRQWLVWPIGLAIAAAIEVYALSAGRWAYSPAMPLLFGIGVTPLVQLAITGALSLWAVRRLIP